MAWRRGVARLPYAVSASLLLVSDRFLTPHRPLFAAVAVAGLSLLGFLAFRRGVRSPQGRFGERRRLEGAFALLAAVEIVSREGSLRFGLPWLSWLVLPYLLVLVYAHCRARHLALLLLFHFLYRSLFSAWNGQESFLLLLSVATAVLFRSQERKKREGITDRLRSFEREAGMIAVGSEEFREQARFEDKKTEHLASMIAEREGGFRALLEIVHRTLQGHTAALFLYDPVEEKFLLKEHQTGSDRFARRSIYPAQGIFKAVLRELTPVRLTSPSGELRGLLYYEGPPVVRSVAAIPVKTDELLKGILILDRLDPVPFSDADLGTAERIAAQMARWIDTSETLHAYFHLKEEVTSLYAASSALNRSLRMEDVMETLLQSARRIVPYDLGLVVLHDPKSDQNRVAAALGEEREGSLGEAFACAPERGLVSWVIRNQAPLSYNDFRSREGKTPLFNRRRPLPNLFESVFLIPMQVLGEPLGAVLFASKKNHFFSRNERKMLEVVTTQAAIAIKNARMVGALERLATTDGLTGLFNHRTFQETLGRELERSGRHPSATSLLLIDIDHFKKFNDEYGHPVGDFVLKEVAGVLSREVRKVDAVCRHGGEEFAVILVNTSAIGAFRMAERIVAAVARSRFQHEGLTLRVTVSVGAASFPEDAKEREELIERADRALYRAKRTGRNRAVAFTPSLEAPDAAEREKRTIEAAEEELRSGVDRPPLPV
ncbi:MAG: diguanylate cyclase [Pseudomonadota bacterium]